MREKKWKNYPCPSCGSEDTLIRKKNLTFVDKNKAYGNITIKNLDGFECKSCKKSVFTNNADRKRQAQLSEQIALIESQKITASELLPIEEFAKLTKRSRQRIHQMMNEGKIRYVFIGKRIRFPLRCEVTKAKMKK